MARNKCLKCARLGRDVLMVACVSHRIPRNGKPTERECRRCGTAFVTQNKNTQYCSAGCRNEQNTADKISRYTGIAIPSHKTCSKCQQSKPACEFTTNRYVFDGLRSRCRQCDRDKFSAWKSSKPVGTTQERARECNLARNFGMTTGDYDAILNIQGGVCALCKKPPHEGKKRMAVDHDHKTGEIRGLLHLIPCNKLLVGQHSIDTLRAALEYLTAPPARSISGEPWIISPSPRKHRQRMPASGSTTTKTAG